MYVNYQILTRSVVMRRTFLSAANLSPMSMLSSSRGVLRSRSLLPSCGRKTLRRKASDAENEESQHCCTRGTQCKQKRVLALLLRTGFVFVSYVFRNFETFSASNPYCIIPGRLLGTKHEPLESIPVGVQKLAWFEERRYRHIISTTAVQRGSSPLRTPQTAVIVEPLGAITATQSIRM